MTNFLRRPTSVSTTSLGSWKVWLPRCFTVLIKLDNGCLEVSTSPFYNFDNLRPINFSVWIPIEQFSVKTPTIAARLTLLRASSSVDLLRSALSRKHLPVTQELVIDWHLLSSREVECRRIGGYISFQLL